MGAVWSSMVRRRVALGRIDRVCVLDGVVVRLESSADATWLYAQIGAESGSSAHCHAENSAFNDMFRNGRVSSVGEAPDEVVDQPGCPFRVVCELAEAVVCWK